LSGTDYIVSPQEPIYTAEVNTISLPIDRSDLPASGEGSVNVKVIGTSVIGFRDDGPWGESPVGEVLINLLEYVDNSVVASFKPFFDLKLR
jgi:hypothetical protein